MRRKVNKYKDRKKFTATARPKKAINVNPVSYRGGIRL